MPHQCVRCNTFYADDAKEIINGCSSCSGKLFFYVKQAKVEQARATVEKLTEEQIEELEENVEDIIGHEDDAPIVLDLESIRMVSAGKYELDLKQLLDPSKPVIYKLDEGKYLIDLVTTFNTFKKKK
jgi:uncharacterized protein